jgi:cytochrome c
MALAIAGGSAVAAGDPARGRQLFRACAACHTVDPGEHRTGPSLAGILGRRAGAEPTFRRYSPALRGSGLVWDEAHLDAWLADPEALVPGNRMAFGGIDDAAARADLIAYLADPRQAAGGHGGMMGMGVPEMPDLKTLGPAQQVMALRHCADAYEVETVTGERYVFWEFNLRFKTDGSHRGPHPGAPVIVGAGMQGDRASVVFAAPQEISGFIRAECPPDSTQ